MTDRSVAHHIANLGHKNPDIRRNAANALGEIGDPVAAPALIGRLNDKAEYVRRKAMLALKRIGAPAAPALARGLRSGEDLVRTAVFEVLMECGDGSAVPGLIEAVKDENVYVRDAAVTLLSKIGDVAAVPTLIAVLRDRYDALWREKYEAATRDEVAAALAAVVFPANSLKIPGNRPSPVWQYEHNRVRCNAARALGTMGAVAAMPALIEALHEEDLSVRQYAVEALGRLGDLAAVPALIQAWNRGTGEERRLSFSALWRLGETVALPRRILADTRFSVQERIDLLERLRQVRYDATDQAGKAIYLCQFSETSVFCNEVLAEEDEDARRGAQAVLNWMNGERHLLHASQEDSKKQFQELVRPSQKGASIAAPQNLLRSSEVPETPPDPLPPPLNFWQRLFRKATQ